LVNSVAHHGVFFSRMRSGIGRNIQFCCEIYGMCISDLLHIPPPPPHTTTVLRLFFWDHPGEPVPEENFWTLWWQGKINNRGDTLTIRLGATPSKLTGAHLHHPHIFFTGRMPFQPPNQQCQSTECKSTEGTCHI